MGNRQTCSCVTPGRHEDRAHDFAPRLSAAETTPRTDSAAFFTSSPRKGSAPGQGNDVFGRKRLEYHPHGLPALRCGNFACQAADGSGALCVEVTSSLSGETIMVELDKKFVQYSTAEMTLGKKCATFSLIDFKRAIFSAAVEEKQRLPFTRLDARMRRQNKDRTTGEEKFNQPIPRTVPTDFGRRPFIMKDPPFLRGTSRCVSLIGSPQSHEENSRMMRSTVSFSESPDVDGMVDHILCEEIHDSYITGDDPLRELEAARLCTVQVGSAVLKSDHSYQDARVDLDEIASSNSKPGLGDEDLRYDLSFVIRENSLRDAVEKLSEVDRTPIELQETSTVGGGLFGKDSWRKATRQNAAGAGFDGAAADGVFGGGQPAQEPQGGGRLGGGGLFGNQPPLPAALFRNYGPGDFYLEKIAARAAAGGGDDRFGSQPPAHENYSPMRLHDYLRYLGTGRCTRRVVVTSSTTGEEGQGRAMSSTGDDVVVVERMYYSGASMECVRPPRDIKTTFEVAAVVDLGLARDVAAALSPAEVHMLLGLDCGALRRTWEEARYYRPERRFKEFHPDAVTEMLWDAVTWTALLQSESRFLATPVEAEQEATARMIHQETMKLMLLEEGARFGAVRRKMKELENDERTFTLHEDILSHIKDGKDREWLIVRDVIFVWAPTDFLLQILSAGRGDVEDAEEGVEAAAANHEQAEDPHPCCGFPGLRMESLLQNFDLLVHDILEKNRGDQVERPCRSERERSQLASAFTSHPQFDVLKLCGDGCPGEEGHALSLIAPLVRDNSREADSKLRVKFALDSIDGKFGHFPYAEVFSLQPMLVDEWKKRRFSLAMCGVRIHYEVPRFDEPHNTKIKVRARQAHGRSPVMNRFLQLLESGTNLSTEMCLIILNRFPGLKLYDEEALARGIEDVGQAHEARKEYNWEDRAAADEQPWSKDPLGPPSVPADEYLERALRWRTEEVCVRLLERMKEQERAVAELRFYLRLANHATTSRETISLGKPVILFKGGDEEKRIPPTDALIAPINLIDLAREKGYMRVASELAILLG
ncbi:unnamed protein product [Amoebophrya sp. A25]|nr:unnamed protein product [Amoebophrya sp. A25]|eukprot:GSA25T00019087001.1